jgi:hypothetical protein
MSTVVKEKIVFLEEFVNVIVGNIWYVPLISIKGPSQRL